MKLIELIQKNKNWKNILESKHIKITYEKFSNGHTLALFKYDIQANFTDAVVRECRGVILDLDTLKVVCRPFDKFCNYGEPGADKIDWTSARVQQKIDGSIMKLWWYDNAWHISTNGTINAFNANALGSDYSFGQLFMEGAKKKGLDFNILDRNFTYIFELTSPYNRIVVDYGKEIDLWHLGTRNNITGQEIHCQLGIHQPKEYKLSSLDDCIEAAKHLNDNVKGVENEGFVVVDKNWHRIKVKSPSYVAIHHILPNGEISDEKILSLIREGEIDEVLTYVPSLAGRVDKIRGCMVIFQHKFKKYVELCQHEVELMQKQYSDIEKPYIRKDFAIKHQHDPMFSFAIVNIFDNKTNSLEQLADKKYFELMKKVV